jgi:hypothetical protein
MWRHTVRYGWQSVLKGSISAICVIPDSLDKRIEEVVRLPQNLRYFL